MKKLLIAAAIAGASLAAQAKDIVDTAVAAGQFKTLATALQAADTKTDGAVSRAFDLDPAKVRVRIGARATAAATAPSPAPPPQPAAADSPSLSAP